MRETETVTSARPRLQSVELVLAIVSVAGSTEACAAHGDAATADVLSEFYATIAKRVQLADGSFIKPMGTGGVITFPTARAREAVAALRDMQRESNMLWQRLDARCRVQVKVGA